MRFIYLFLIITSNLSAGVTHQVDIRVGKLSCSRVSETTLRSVLHEASSLLASTCGLRIRYRGFEAIPTHLNWCLLPADRKKRIHTVQAFSLPFRQGSRAQEISVFLVDATVNHRMAWAHYKRHKTNACGYPHRLAYFPFLGSIFLSNDAFLTAEAADTDAMNNEGLTRKISMASLLLTHELVHALTQQGHPTRQKAGNILADITADIGENISFAQCNCMLKSPWVHKISQP